MKYKILEEKQKIYEQSILNAANIAITYISYLNSNMLHVAINENYEK